jgi:hypothetical protein
MRDDETVYLPHKSECGPTGQPCQFEREKRDIFRALKAISDDIGEIKTTLAVGSERFKRIDCLEKNLEATTKATLDTKQTQIRQTETIGTLKAVVYGAVAIGLTSLAGAILSLVIDKGPAT